MMMMIYSAHVVLVLTSEGFSNGRLDEVQSRMLYGSLGT